MIAIRDDDTSFWTKPEDLMEIYGSFLERGGKLSLAVVPNSYKLITPGDRNIFHISKEKRFVYENESLVQYLKPYVKKQQIEIMLHGYDHSYATLVDGKVLPLFSDVRSIIGNIDTIPFLPECIYKDEAQFIEELKLGKEILEDTFHTNVTTFVPPSNSISANIVEGIASLKLNLSGTILPSFNRKKTVKSTCCYAKKTLWRLFEGDHAYPYVLDYGNHRELGAHTFAPSSNLDHEVSEFLYCQAKGYDYVLATHYWEISKGSKLKKALDKILNKCGSYNTSLLSNILNGKKK